MSDDIAFLPDCPIYRTKSLIRFLGCSRDGWARLKECGLEPFRIGNARFVDRANFLDACAKVRSRPVVQAAPAATAVAEPEQVDLRQLRWLTVQQSAEYLQISTKTIRRLIAKRRLIPRDKVGRQMIDRKHLDAAVASLRRSKR